MATSRGAHKVERVTITLVPKSDERSFIPVPSTFNRLDRTYGWRHAEQMEYMIVPTRISSTEVKVDLFLAPQSKGKAQGWNLQKAVQNFVKEKIESEWKGLRLGSIGRPTVATPPGKTYVRSSIEEMLGAQLEG